MKNAGQSSILAFAETWLAAVMSRWPVILGVWVVISELLSRALLPGVRGAVVGISGAIDDADTILGVVAYLTAKYLLATALLYTFRVVRSRLALRLRILIIPLSASLFFASVGTMVSSRTPTTVSAMTCAVCGITAIVLGVTAFRRAEVGLAALAPVLAGVASIVRGVGAVVSERASEVAADLQSVTGAFRFATILATISFALALGAIGVACAWLVRRSRRRGGVVVGFILVAATVGAFIAASAPDDLEPIAFVVLRRGVQHLLTRPAPMLPGPFVMGVVLATPLVALASMLQRGAPPRLAAAVGLAVLAGDSAEIPILGLGLACASLFLASYAADPHGVVAAVTAADNRRAMTDIGPPPEDDAVSGDPEASLPP